MWPGQYRDYTTLDGRKIGTAASLHRSRDVQDSISVQWVDLLLRPGVQAGVEPGEWILHKDWELRVDRVLLPPEPEWETIIRCRGLQGGLVEMMTIIDEQQDWRQNADLSLTHVEKIIGTVKAALFTPESVERQRHAAVGYESDTTIHLHRGEDRVKVGHILSSPKGRWRVVAEEHDTSAVTRVMACKGINP